MKNFYILLLAALFCFACEKDETPEPQNIETTTGGGSGKDTIFVYNIFGAGTGKQITCTFILNTTANTHVKTWDTTFIYNGGYSLSEPLRIPLKLRGIPSSGDYKNVARISKAGVSAVETSGNVTLEFEDSESSFINGYKTIKGELALGTLVN